MNYISSRVQPVLGKMLRYHWLWRVGAYLSFLVELRLFTDWRNRYGPYQSPIYFYIAGVLLCICALGTALSRPVDGLPSTLVKVWRYPLAYVLLLLGSGWVLLFQGPIIAQNVIDAHYSDVIPILQTYVTRFLSGEVVYKYITTLDYPLFPNHLPLQWLPYVLAEKAQMDYRWLGLWLLLLVGFGGYQWALVQQAAERPMPLLEFVAKALLPCVVFTWIVNDDPGLYAHTIEPTIIAYYCLLAASVLSRSALFQALGLVLCLLSRYSVVLWVPLYLLILWRELGWRHLLTVSVLVGVGILAIYVVPFLSKDWSIFGHALSEYRIATLGEWSRGNPPGHLFNGLGMASWFYTYASGSLDQKITLLQRVHLLASGGVVAVLALVYWRLRKRMDYRLLALFALKVYLATFYAFLQIPYSYLTSLTLFMSVFVLLTVDLWRPRQPVRM